MNETKQESSQWKSPTSLHPKMGRQVHSNVKGLLIIFQQHCASGVHYTGTNYVNNSICTFCGIYRKMCAI